MTQPILRKWWKEGTMYQVWPASFRDSTGSGRGDIKGIIASLDYLRQLGVDLLWCSPMYASPQADMGYDISDFEAIAPEYGSMADAERLISECHARGMRILFDLVINHTSDEHAWFRDSRSSKHSAKRDWYIWRPARYITDDDGANGDGDASNSNADRSGLGSASDKKQRRLPPNNWRSFFGGSAWEWDEGSQEYYLHLFAKEQPDLNWEQAATRQAIYASAMTFWLDRGLDGFRIDTVNLYSKPERFVDAPVLDPTSAFQLDMNAICNGPRMHEFLSEMHALLAAHGAGDHMTVGELVHTDNHAHTLRYVSAGAKQLDMIFQFDVAGVGRRDRWFQKPWSVADFRRAITTSQALAADASNDAWGTVFLENHDLARSVSRYCPAAESGVDKAAAAKLLALMLVCLSGTLTVYQGQEIGMVNAPREWGLEEYRDVDVHSFVADERAKYKARRENKKKSQGVEASEDSAEVEKEKAAEEEAILNSLSLFSRDHARTLMQWSGQEPDAGFSPATDHERPSSSTKTKPGPWIGVNPNFRDGVNVEAQSQENKNETNETGGGEQSVLGFWKTAIRLRTSAAWKDVLVYGSYEVLDLEGEGGVFAFVKREGWVVDDLASGSGSGSGSGSAQTQTKTQTGTETEKGTEKETTGEKKKRKAALVILNFTGTPQEWDVDRNLKPITESTESEKLGDLILGTKGGASSKEEEAGESEGKSGHEKKEGGESEHVVSLEAWEGRVYELLT